MHNAHLQFTRMGLRELRSKQAGQCHRILLDRIEKQRYEFGGPSRLSCRPQEFAAFIMRASSGRVDSLVVWISLAKESASHGQLVELANCQGSGTWPAVSRA